MCRVRAVPGSCCCWPCSLPLAASLFALGLPLTPYLLGSSALPLPRALLLGTQICFLWCWRCSVSALSPETFVRAFKNLLWWICAPTALEDRSPSLFFLSFCLFRDEILGVICRIAFMSMLAVLSGHLEPPRFRQKMHHFSECCR